MPLSNPDIDHMIDNPAEYGFEWRFGPLHRGEKRDVLVRADAPYMFFSGVARLDLVRRAFGDGFALSNMDGTSSKVVSQRARNDIIANPAITTRELQRLCLQRALGMRKSAVRSVTVVEKIVNVPTFIANDGTEFTDKLECMQYNMLLAAEANIEK
jgi:hypothetical protein